jgi:hypothetical protein
MEQKGRRRYADRFRDEGSPYRRVDSGLIGNLPLLFVSERVAREYERLPVSRSLMITRPPSFNLLKVDTWHQQDEALTEVRHPAHNHLREPIFHFTQRMARMQREDYLLLIRFLLKPVSRDSPASGLTFKGLSVVLERLHKIHAQHCQGCRHVQQYWEMLGVQFV